MTDEPTPGDDVIVRDGLGNEWVRVDGRLGWYSPHDVSRNDFRFPASWDQATAHQGRVYLRDGVPASRLAEAEADLDDALHLYREALTDFESQYAARKRIEELFAAARAEWEAERAGYHGPRCNDGIVDTNGETYICHGECVVGEALAEAEATIAALNKQVDQHKAALNVALSYADGHLPLVPGGIAEAKAARAAELGGCLAVLDSPVGAALDGER